MSEEIITYKIKEVSVSDIIFPKDELRTRIIFENLDELARSIRTVGLLNPLTVRVHGDKYELIAGFRRLKACEIVNLATIPCRVVDSDDNTADMQKLHENIFREDINPVDEGNFFKRLLVKNNWRIIDLAAQIHKSPSYVSRRVQLTEADPYIVNALQDNQINISIADELSKIDDPDTRHRLLHYAIHSGATVETVRSWRVQYEIDQVNFPPQHIESQNGDHKTTPPPVDPITKMGEDPGPTKQIEERVIETRPCFSCLAKVDTRDVFVMYLCADCKRSIEKALHPDLGHNEELKIIETTDNPQGVT